MEPKLVYLKVKIKSLQAEAKIIRKEERKAKKFRDGLHNHRVVDVRREQRATLLAYGYLRGKALREIEQHTSYLPYSTRERIRRMVEKYGTKEQLAGVKDWYATQPVEFVS